MIHHRKRTKIAFLLSIIAIVVLAVATNGVLQQKNTPMSYKNQPTTPSTNTVTNETVSEAASVKSPSSEEITTIQEPDVSPPPEQPAAATGSEVLYPSGPKLTVPTPWVYSFTTENSGTVLNFGTQQFTESNPYNSTLIADASGYFGPESITPTEAIGPLSDEQIIPLTTGGEVTVRTFTADVQGTVLDQVVAVISWNGQMYGAVLYTAAQNTDQVSRFMQLVGSIANP